MAASTAAYEEAAKGADQFLIAKALANVADVLSALGRDAEAAEVAATLGGSFPADVAAALRALAARDDDAFAAAVADVRRSYENRDGYLEDIPVADT